MPHHARWIGALAAAGLLVAPLGISAEEPSPSRFSGDDQEGLEISVVYFDLRQDTGKFGLVATERHRFALVDRSVGSEAKGLASGVIIPRKGLAELNRLVEEEDADEIEPGFERSSGPARKGGATLVMKAQSEPASHEHATQGWDDSHMRSKYNARPSPVTRPPIEGLSGYGALANGTSETRTEVPTTLEVATQRN